MPSVTRLSLTSGVLPTRSTIGSAYFMRCPFMSSRGCGVKAPGGLSARDAGIAVACRIDDNTEATSSRRESLAVATAPSHPRCQQRGDSPRRMRSYSGDVPRSREAPVSATPPVPPGAKPTVKEQRPRSASAKVEEFRKKQARAKRNRLIGIIVGRRRRCRRRRSSSSSHRAHAAGRAYTPAATGATIEGVETFTNAPPTSRARSTTRRTRPPAASTTSG